MIDPGMLLHFGIFLIIFHYEWSSKGGNKDR